MQDPGSKIVLVGQGRWSRVLAEGLQHHCGLSVNVVAFDHASDALAIAHWSAIVRARTVVRVGFRPGARTWRGRGLDAAFALATQLGPRKRVICYWIGTDVRNALADVSAGRPTPAFTRARDRWTHIAGSQPLADDLALIGIDADVVDFPWRVDAHVPEVTPLPARFTVLTYVPDARAAFYDGPTIVEAARRLPDVRFRIAGGDGTWTSDAPDNVEFLGWLGDMEPAYRDSSVVVRLAEYDSLGGTMLEGLLHGRAVIYSRPFPRTIHVPFGDADALVEQVGRLQRLHSAGELSADAETAEWAREFCDPHRRFTGLAHVLTARD